MKRAFLSIALVAAVLLSGCQSVRRIAGSPTPPPPQNYFSPETHGFPMRRVALLPLFSDRFSGDYLRDVDAAFASELTKKALFEVAPVSRAELEKLGGSRQLSSVETLPAELLSKLRDHFGADGVLFADLTHFNPYRPVAIGVRAKLIDPSSAEVRWAFDYVFDSGHPAIAEAARRFQLASSNEQSPLRTDGGSVLLSPHRFAKYVASETFASLQKP